MIDPQKVVRLHEGGVRDERDGRKSFRNLRAARKKLDSFLVRGQVFWGVYLLPHKIFKWPLSCQGSSVWGGQEDSASRGPTSRFGVLRAPGPMVSLAHLRSIHSRKVASLNNLECKRESCGRRCSSRRRRLPKGKWRW